MHVGRKFSSVATPSTYIGIWKNAKPFLRGKEQLHSSYTLQKQLYSIHPSILPVSSAYSFQGRWESEKLANESNCCMTEIFTQTKQKLSIGQTLVSLIFFPYILGLYWLWQWRIDRKAEGEGGRHAAQGSFLKLKSCLCGLTLEIRKMMLFLLWNFKQTIAIPCNRLIKLKMSWNILLRKSQTYFPKMCKTCLLRIFFLRQKNKKKYA